MMMLVVQGGKKLLSEWASVNINPCRLRIASPPEAATAAAALTTTNKPSATTGTFLLA